MSSLTRQRPQLPEPIEERAELSIRHLVATPRYRVESPSLACIAAITWIFNIYRPRLSVNLSVGDGVAFFAGCQAVDRLQSSDLMHGHVQRDEIARDRVMRFNAENYAHFASLFDYADSIDKSRYRNASIDLIYVEIGDPAQVDVTALVDKWTPKLSGGGCIVIQHGCVTGVGGGVDGLPLPPDIAEGALAIHCGDTAGLVLLPVGEDQPAPIVRLRDAGGSTELDFVFSRLGLLHRNEVLARAYKNKLDHDDVNKGEANGAVDTVQYDHEIAALNQQLAVAEAEGGALRAELAERDSRLEALSAQTDESRALAFSEKEATKMLRLRIARLEGETDIRFKETATLTLKCEQLGQRLATALSETEAAEVENRRHAETLEHRDRRLDEQQTELQAVETDRASLRAAWQDQADRLTEALAQRAETERTLRDARAEAERLSAAAASWEAQGRARDEVIAASHRANEALERRLADLEQRLADAVSDVAVGRGALNEAHSRIESLERDKRRLALQVETIRGTTSWKATAPIRNAGKAIRNLTRSER